MTFTLLQELLEPKNRAIEEQRPFIDKICKLLFRQAGSYSSSKHYGVINQQAGLPGPTGVGMMLTFDNSNAQAEFELNSLTPLGIHKDSDTVKELERMYIEHGVKSKAKLKFITKGGKSVLRGINFGKQVDEKVIRMIQDVTGMLAQDFKK